MQVDLGDATVGDGLPCYIIAELGINHNGDVAIAEQMIDAAADAGADAVKLQRRTVDAVYTQEYLDSPRESPWGTTQREQKGGLELGSDELTFLAEHANGWGMEMTASAWDLEALRDVVDCMEPNWLKVASAHVTDLHFLRSHVLLGRPLVVSTGMCTRLDVSKAQNLLRAECTPHVLLQCTSTYPAFNSEINLRCIQAYKTLYGVPVGYSGHERGIATSVAAVAMGACIVERHLTLDHTMYGSDQSASLEPQGFKQMVRDIRAVEEAMGDGVKRVYEREVPIMEKLRGGGLSER